MLLKSLKYILATIIFFLSFNLAFSTDLIIPKIKPSKQKDALLKNLSSNIKNTTVIGLETGVKDNIVIPENLNLLQKKTYGKTIIYIFKLS